MKSMLNAVFLKFSVPVFANIIGKYLLKCVRMFICYAFSIKEI